MGDKFYSVKKKADSFKDSINQVTEALDAKKAIYDEFAGSSDNSQDKIDEAKVQLKELQEKYTNTVTSIQDLQEEYDRNSALISGRKATRCSRR